MRSALSHTERVMKRNFQTILREIPNGGEFRITGPGIVIRKGLTQAEYMYPPPCPPNYRGGGRGRGLLYNRPSPLNNEGQY